MKMILTLTTLFLITSCTENKPNFVEAQRTISSLKAQPARVKKVRKPAEDSESAKDVSEIIKLLTKCAKKKCSQKKYVRVIMLAYKIESVHELFVYENVYDLYKVREKEMSRALKSIPKDEVAAQTFAFKMDRLEEQDQDSTGNG